MQREHTYNLATLRGNSDGNSYVNVIKRISTEEYKLISSDIDVVGQFRYVHELMSIFTSIEDDIKDAIPNRNATNLKRLYIEAGSTFYMIQQVLEANINKRFGSKSKERKLFSVRLQKERGDCFEYRLMYDLRNFMIHCGFPPMEIHSSIKLSRLIVQSTDLLSLQYKWQYVTKQDLEENHPIDLLQVCERVERCLSDLTIFYLNLLDVREMYYSSQRLLSYSQYRKKESEGIVVFQYDDERNAKAGDFQIKDLMVVPIEGANEILKNINVNS